MLTVTGGWALGPGPLTDLDPLASPGLNGDMEANNGRPGLTAEISFEAEENSQDQGHPVSGLVMDARSPARSVPDFAPPGQTLPLGNWQWPQEI